MPYLILQEVIATTMCVVYTNEPVVSVWVNDFEQQDIFQLLSILIKAT
jgi:hypothetical protein